MNGAAFSLAAGSLAVAMLPDVPHAAQPEVHSVAYVIDNIEQLHGQKLFIRGWLNGCDEGLLCYLSALPKKMSAKSLRIGLVREIEWHLGHLDGHEVVLEAVVTKECKVNLCLDRGLDLIPVRAVKFSNVNH